MIQHGTCINADTLWMKLTMMSRSQGLGELKLQLLDQTPELKSQYFECSSVGWEETKRPGARLCSGIVMNTMKMKSVCNSLHGLKAAMIMVAVQTSFAGVNVFYKLAANDGMNLNIVVAYRFIFAAAFIVPLALIVERKSRPKLTWKIVIQGFFCGLFGGSLAQNLYIESLSLTSATFAASMSNLIPAVTFVLALFFRMEKLAIRSWPGKAKLLGTLIGIGGAMLLTFYKGVEVNIFSTHINLLHRPRLSPPSSSSHNHNARHLLGALLALGSCCSSALWLIIQAKMSEEYPCQYSSTALMAVMGSIQATVFALCVERDFSMWKLGWNIRLLTSAYSGIVASGLMVVLIAWCVRIKGPLYVSVFNPLMLLLVAIAGSLFLNEKLYLGSILGGFLIVCGLYAVLWGKGKELQEMKQLEPQLEAIDSFKDKSSSVKSIIKAPLPIIIH